MTPVSTCPSCGAPVDRGRVGELCPGCLLRAALDGEPTVPVAANRPPEPEEIQLLFPDLEIVRMLGRGGMGVVYQARQPSLDRFAALKILPRELGEQPGFRERFHREARTLAALNHPHIVTIYESGERQGLFFFLMEFVDGGDLGRIIRAGAVAPAQALAIIPQICDALQYAHEAGVVHRDIKPGNILLDSRGRVKVADFGIAKMVGAAADPGVPREYMLGTPEYMAPEQRAAGAAVDHRADIYSLGVVFYELLTGKPPPPDAIPALPSSRVRLDVRLDEVVLRALAENPERRYQQITEFRDSVNLIVHPKPTGTRSAVLATLSAAALVGSAVLLHQRHQPPAPPVAAEPLPPVFENGLGMRFRPIPGTTAKLSIWETRLRDWRAFSGEKDAKSSHPDDPVAGMSLPLMRDFCRWLTTRERAAGRLRTDETYRLPTDREWSLAAGLSEPADAKPEDLSGQPGGTYPWGSLAPAPAGAGNYPDSALRERLPNAVVIPAYYDGHPFACPVGSFRPNSLGFHDLGGNLWETTFDEADGNQTIRLRGGSWLAGSRDGDWKCLRAAYRAKPAEVSPLETGFRVVLAKTAATREPTLAECARDGLLDRAAALLAKGAAVDERDADGRTPLHLAAAGGHAGLVGLLLKAGADLEATDGTGSTPLHGAAMAGSLPVVEALVAAGAKVRARTRLTGAEPVGLAAKRPEILSFLADHGADLRTRDNLGNSSLHQAAITAARESVAWLAEHQVPLEARNIWGFTPLTCAAVAGDPETCALLIRSGASTNPPAAENGITLLAMAAMCGNPDVVELLLQHGADPQPPMVALMATTDMATFQLGQQRRTAPNVLGKLPLVLSPPPPGDRAKVIRLLVKAGLPLEQTDHRGLTPLLHAAFQGNIEAVQTLLDLGAKADAADAEEFTALHSAAEQGFVKVVELLLANGLDLEAVHCRNRTALDCAALMGHQDVVERLLDAGAKPDGAPDAPSTPADTAARQGNAAILEMLLAHGADPNAAGKGGVTPLLGAACGPWLPAENKATPLSEVSKVPHGTAADYLRCVRILLEKGADPLATADDGSTALHQAALCNQADAARLLLDARVPANARNKHLLTPLHSAAHGNAVDAAKVLLEHGATVKPDLASYTPLHAAGSAGALDMVALLLDHGADPNQRDGQNSTPLHRAVISGNLPLVKLLASRGADLACRDFVYATPLHLAVFADKPEIIRALVAAGADPALRNMEGMTPGDIAKQLRRDSCAAALTRGKTPAGQADALKEYLKRHPDWRQLQEKDCDPEDLKFARKSFGAGFSPYYYEEDFNSDGRNDFAVILVNKAPPVENKELADSHKWQYQLRVVVFNGLPGGGYDAVFAEDDQGPLACFLNKWKEPNSKLYFGVLETGQGFVIVPTERGYRFEHAKKPG